MVMVMNLRFLLFLLMVDQAVCSNFHCVFLAHALHLFVFQNCLDIDIKFISPCEVYNMHLANQLESGVVDSQIQFLVGLVIVLADIERSLSQLGLTLTMGNSNDANMQDLLLDFMFLINIKN